MITQRSKTTDAKIKWLLSARMKKGGVCRFQLRNVGVADGWMMATDGHRIHRVKLFDIGILAPAFSGSYRVYKSDGHWLFVLDPSAAFPMQAADQFLMTHFEIPRNFSMVELSDYLAAIVRALPESEWLDVDFLRDALGQKHWSVDVFIGKETSVPVLIRHADGRQAVIMPKGV